MSEILLRKVRGVLIGADDEAEQFIQKVALGTTLRCSVTKMRNPKFHRKWFVLAKFAFDIWVDTVKPLQYKGQPVKATFDRFRKDLTILAGYYESTYNVRGEVRLEAKSLSWAKMSEEEFAKLYSDTIDTILTKVLNRPDLTPEKVRAAVDELMRFDG